MHLPILLPSPQEPTFFLAASAPMHYKGGMDRRRLELWLQGGLFLGLFVYVWRGVQPQLLYHGFGVFAACPVFSWEAPFLRTAFDAPGGPLNALAELLALLEAAAGGGR